MVNISIKQITDKSQWESFVIANENTFLQSWNWGEFNKNTGEKIWRLGVFDGDNLMAAALVIRVKARRGLFLFVPNGLIMKLETGNCQPKAGPPRAEKLEIWKKFFEHLRDSGKKEKVGFIRISPLLGNNGENLSIFKNYGFRSAPIHMMHPETTWVLDITKSEDEIMKNMRKTHRNLIRRAEKEGVEIIKSADEEYLKAFYSIHEETVRRHKFVPFSYAYIKSEIDAFKDDNQIEIFSAKYKGKIISSAIIVFYGDQAFYHHGASSSEHGKIPSSYLNLWEAIKEAKKRGKKIFNFYGIAENKPSHPWSGLSKFKMGFGGYKKELLHCQDLPLSGKYIITWLIETMRKIKRGY